MFSPTTSTPSWRLPTEIFPSGGRAGDGVVSRSVPGVVMYTIEDIDTQARNGLTVGACQGAFEPPMDFQKPTWELPRSLWKYRAPLAASRFHIYIYIYMGMQSLPTGSLSRPIRPITQQSLMGPNSP